jgi:hypothetical protein
VADQVGPGDAEGVEAAAQVGGVAVDGVVEAGRLVGLAEPGWSQATARASRPARSSSGTQSWLEPGLPWTETTASSAGAPAGRASSSGARMPSTVRMVREMVACIGEVLLADQGRSGLRAVQLAALAPRITR